MSKRLDHALVTRGMVKTRSQASMLIKQGDIHVNDKKITKAGFLVNDADKISISERGLYVSRGAYKLIKAIEEFKLDFKNKTIADCGASTGGFTQVSLLNHAQKVYAIDVGHDQLDELVKNNPRVESMEGINLKHEFKLPELVDFCVVDLSFISLKLVLENIANFLKPTGLIVALVKPQFEAGKERVGKGGIVKIEDSQTILDEIFFWLKENHFNVISFCDSPISGKAGNNEYLALIEKA